MREQFLLLTLCDRVSGGCKPSAWIEQLCGLPRGVEMERYSESKKRGCPTCDGIDAKACMRCQGKTRQRDWWNTSTGWAHESELSQWEREDAGLTYNAALNRTDKA